MARKKPLKKKPYNYYLLIGGILGICILLYFLFSLFTKPHCANTISCTKDLSGNVNYSQTNGEFMGKPVIVPSDVLEALEKQEPVLGARSRADKKIFVNLSNQHLYAYEGDKLVYDFVISSGRFQPTPVGKFYIWSKLLATHMEGGDKEEGTYYSLPNVPYTMYFYNNHFGKWEGYGIHGAYWQQTFGYPASFGCITMTIDDAKRLYYWTNPFPTTNATFATEDNPGTPVIIYGKSPAI